MSVRCSKATISIPATFLEELESHMATSLTYLSPSPSRTTCKTYGLKSTVLAIVVVTMLLCVYLASIATVAHLLYRYLSDNLKAFPGPTLARWTNLWRFHDCITTWHEKPSTIQLHQK